MIESGSGDPQAPRWWVMHTRPRCEKKLAAWFRRQGWECALPLRRQRRDYRSKSVVFQLPLFPGYLFGRFAERDRSAVYGSGHAARLLEVVDQGTFLLQLAAIGEALQSGGEAETVPYLEPGRRVRITSGQFRGLEGRIERRSSGRRLVLSLDILQQSVAVEIDRDRLQLAA